MTASNRFKVVIVGAGVAGLTLAHCLDKAKINYVLLDKGVVAPTFGTTVTIQPHGLRILYQLGLLDPILAQSDMMGGAHCRTPDGKSYASNDFFGVVRRRAGYDTKTLDRQRFLQTLYDNLPDKTRVHESARVEHVFEENSRVRVVLADGREFTGDMVVGADGVHSKMREIMWDKANAESPGTISVDEKRAMVTTYNAIVMASKPIPGLGSHDMEITSNPGFSFLLLCQPDWISIIVHNKLPEEQQCTWPTRRRFTNEDMETLAKKLAGYPINESVVFGELWKNKLKAQMISLEESCLDHWHFGRTVLMGDAIHKLTPNSALGANTAMEDAVVVANILVEALAAHPNKKPTDVEIRDAMQKYQDSRIGRVKAIVKAAGDLTRLQAYDGWKFYLNQRWITPIVGLDFLAGNIAKLCVGAPKLSYVQFDEQRGTLGWDDTKAAEAQRRDVGMPSQKDKSGNGWREWRGDFESAVPKLLSVLVGISAITWVFLLGSARYSVPGFTRVVGVLESNLTTTS
ncbi:hypothetical protein O1611_g10396 [Lasiodiplodia mahajangana]|uniref:Uncharacterized protein n=1 Tax=Lasiodiplodia mahajangana TaxID=1108764 RepID=A0ACC2IYL7_9PEZI|nr:hypothetical protein O1611_g10396 [Lasiodiplodia mahajangana]